MTKGDQLPDHLVDCDYNTITIDLPTHALNDILNKGVEGACWSNIRDIVLMIKHENAPIAVNRSTAENFTITVSCWHSDEKKTWRRSFSVTGLHTIRDLAAAIEGVSGISVEIQMLTITLNDGLEVLFHPSKGKDAVQTMQMLGLRHGAVIDLEENPEIAGASEAEGWSPVPGRPERKGGLGKVK